MSTATFVAAGAMKEGRLVRSPSPEESLSCTEKEREFDV